MGMVSQNTQIPSTHPITGELMYNNEPMPNRAGVPNRSVNDMTAIDSSYPMDPNKIPALQGTMTAKFGSIAKYMDDPIKNMDPNYNGEPGVQQEDFEQYK